MPSEASSAELAAFLVACQSGDASLAETLLRQSPSLAFATEAQSESNATGLWLAAEGGHVPVVIAILRSLNGHGEEVARIVRQAREPEHVTPLYVACQNGHAATVAALCKALSSFCDKSAQRSVLNVAKTTGATPLYIAAQQGFLTVLRTLIVHCADVDMATNKGLTPLMIAAYQGHAACVHALLDAHADPNLRTTSGKDALQWATAGAAAFSAQQQSGKSDSVAVDHDEVVRLLTQAMRVKDATVAVAKAGPSAPVPVPDDTPAAKAHQLPTPPTANPAVGGGPPLFTPEELGRIATDWEAFRCRILEEAKSL